MINGMQVVIIAVGKESSQAVLKLQQEYERRLTSWADINWKLIPASRLTDIQQIRAKESEAILSQLKPNDTVILLDERGSQQTNEEFAKTFERLASAQGRLVVVIGGAYGVDETVRNRATFTWSLSLLVFPHQIVRIMLLEQIYRTFTVLHNHPYHHS